ncbi:MAG: hypothetical protein WCJ45_09220 [bacterium]
MRKKKLSSEYVRMKSQLCTMASRIKFFKGQIFDLQMRLNLTKDQEKIKLIKQELKSSYLRRRELANIYRHSHVAYCELRGIFRERIEKHTPRAKPLLESYIEELKG